MSILIIISGWRVTRDSFHILMEGAPVEINTEEVKSSLLNIPSVQDIHDLHVWSITSGVLMLSCHITINEDGIHDTVLHTAQSILHDKFGIDHSTIQTEKAGFGCPSQHGTCN